MIYAEIVDAALAFSDRQDVEVVNRLDLFIKLVEARVNKKLDTQPMNTQVLIPGVVAQQFYDVPTNWLALRDVNIHAALSNIGKQTLSLISPEQMNNAVSNISSNFYYVIINNKIMVNPTLAADQVLELNYTNRLIPLDTTNTSNWLSINHPDCYIYGILTEINAFVKDPDATNLWDNRFKESISDLTFQDDVATFSGNSLQTRVG